ncbi:hypothetical protein LB534_05050 [Mesorhizobium sp. CA18]|uniref:hypothetical protein n=1 Tax=unclassified Mesorhizobium TaxID=325217 RepID=UPI001CCAE0FE|nr:MULTISPECIES: hypothetical protein [unclassified Mesorhizobium]MBZ9734363.1 hypothetical protein [Mesorhizobium sp. CA9]MBZ9824644.1 hypothetical protein [Mesorhizobium sp. CA18]MBZ9829398.1 hypothetical protein [Mesorhizobium sp. CA2]MBZ9878012.1 hypothetical protein [Mesorhizobium sp. Ca11]MBZ9902890.1 hypothetical protein [Mesorhizobium sp. CA17]
MTNDDELRRRKNLTFEQAEGFAELPRQLLPEEMPDTLRARLLHTIVRSIETEMAERGWRTDLGPTWSVILKRFNVEHLGQLTTTFEPRKSYNLTILEELFESLNAKAVLGVVQALVRLARDRYFSSEVAMVLEAEHSAYRLIDGDTLVPVGSLQEAQSISQAFHSAQAAGHIGAIAHLKGAASELSDGNFADSIRESLHAVESVVRGITGKSKVSDALDELSKRRPLHGSLRRAITQLYGFGSDEPGVRHPLLNAGDAAVAEEDAMLMLGTCASLVTFFSRSFGRRTP